MISTVRLALASVVVAIAAQAADSRQPVSKPKYKIRLDRNVRVGMRDGVEIAAVIVRPEAEGKFPAIVGYTPYRRVLQVRSSYSEAEYNHHLHGASYFAERGYAVMHFDSRGTGNSGGSTEDVYSQTEQKDGYEMIEWIASQPWCSGKVGMWGMSSGGVVLWQVGVQQPPHLTTLLVGSANTDVYLDWVYPGGVLRPYMFDSYTPMIAARNFAPPDIAVAGEKWSDIWNERLEKNVPWGVGLITHQQQGKYWADMSLQTDYSRIKVPVMLWSGWPDPYPTQVLRAFSHLKVPKKVIVGPGGHWWPEMAVPGPQYDGRYEWLKWFDYWLKGIDTGVMDEPPVTLFVRQYKEPAERMYIQDAGFWRHEKEWPLTRTDYRPMYLHPGGKLSREAYSAAEEERDPYVYKPTVGITSGIYWGGGVLPWAQPVDQRLDEAYSLTYTTAPLQEDTEVTGDPRAVLYVSSTADTAYFHLKILDVAPDGTSKWVADGGLLATHRNSHADPEPQKPGEVYELKLGEMDIKYMAYVFGKGHRIRVAIASADFQNAWPTAKRAINAVYRGSKYPSRIILPIAPAQNPKLPPPDLKPSPRPPLKLEEFEQVFPKAEHTITQDFVNQTVTVHLRSIRREKSEDGLTSGTEVTHSSYTVSDANPADATLKAAHEYTIVRPEGEIKVEANEVVASDISSFRYLVRLDITVDGKPHFRKDWTVSVPRKLN